MALPSQMTFGQALEALKEGFRVRRPEWAAGWEAGLIDGLVVLIDPTALDRNLWVCTLDMDDGLALNEDLLAEDWQIVA